MDKQDSKQVDAILELVAAEAQRTPLRAGMDYVQDALWYGVPIENKGLHFVRTGPFLISPADVPPEFAPGKNTLNGFPMSPGAIKAFMKGEVGDGGKLLGDLEDYFARHARYAHADLPSVLAAWSLATYAHMTFPVFPYVSITSAQRSCGKSRVLQMMSEVTFRGKPVDVNPTSATLFRSLDDSAQTLVIDEFDDATEDTKKSMLAILNSGFQNGARVPRCAGDEFEVKRYRTYGPKAFAGLGRLPETLQSRTMVVSRV